MLSHRILSYITPMKKKIQNKIFLLTLLLPNHVFVSLSIFFFSLGEQ